MKMKTITIEVTQEDIDKGKQGSCGRCPIALAAYRVMEGSFLVLPYAIFRLEGKSISLPDSAIEFIGLFDSGMPVKPFSFTIEI